MLTWPFNALLDSKALTIRPESRLFAVPALVAWMGIMVYLATVPRLPHVPIVATGTGSSLGHYATHLVLAMLLYLVASPKPSDVFGKNRAVAAAVSISMVLGLSLEGLQLLLDERGAQVSDVFFNTAGAVTGVAVVSILDSLRVSRAFLSMTITGAAVVSIGFVGISAALWPVPYVDSCRADRSPRSEIPDILIFPRLAPFDQSPYGGDRVTEGLQALFSFEEGRGAIVHDVSSVGTPLDLRIVTETATTWVSGGLFIHAPTLLESSEAATKVISAAQATNEIAIEAWVKPANIIQDGPARIATLSCDTSRRNFTLGQGLSRTLPSDVYDVRIRTTETSDNGTPSLRTPSGTATTAVTHIVYSRNASGIAKVYVDGAEVSSNRDDGDLSNWDRRYRLALANEWTQDRPWLGELHLVAIYNRAMSEAEVKQNFNAGANPMP